MDSSALRASTREKSLKLDKAVIRVFMVELVPCSMLPSLKTFYFSRKRRVKLYPVVKNIIERGYEVNKVDHVYYEEKRCILDESHRKYVCFPNPVDSFL